MNFFSEVMIECFEGLEEKSVSKLEDTIVKCDYPNCMLFTTSGKDSANLSQLYNGVNFFR